MNYCIIFGSPRKRGNTANLLSVVMDELRDRDNEISYFDVYESDIAGCKACLGCQDDPDDICCVIQDDMQPILKAVADSDVVVIAAPVYVWSAPAPVKAVLDRLVYAGCKYYGDDPHGPSLYEGKKLALVTTCGYPVERGTDLFVEALRRFCKHTKMDYIGMLGERHRNLKEPFMDETKRRHAIAFADRLNDVGGEQ
ncbi:MAG: flavodoxin family protein [Peptoniphilus sp.]|nr:flavodoxin family protein [Peptoniphilus sp.]MDD7362852.1 flavodoxin family protein [Bacillota bacterium]MDY6043956.1 flavodoxin family protein [Peptoniphilus sp.]